MLYKCNPSLLLLLLLPTEWGVVQQDGDGGKHSCLRVERERCVGGSVWQTMDGALVVVIYLHLSHFAEAVSEGWCRKERREEKEMEREESQVKRTAVSPLMDYL